MKVSELIEALRATVTQFGAQDPEVRIVSGDSTLEIVSVERIPSKEPTVIPDYVQILVGISPDAILGGMVAEDLKREATT